MSEPKKYKNSDQIEYGDKVLQLFINERYDMFALLDSGRVFKKRARGQSGAYDRWIEQDIITEIADDLITRAEQKS